MIESAQVLVFYIEIREYADMMSGAFGQVCKPLWSSGQGDKWKKCGAIGVCMSAGASASLVMNCVAAASSRPHRSRARLGSASDGVSDMSRLHNKLTKWRTRCRLQTEGKYNKHILYSRIYCNEELINCRRPPSKSNGAKRAHSIRCLYSGPGAV